MDVAGLTNSTSLETYLKAVGSVPISLTLGSVAKSVITLLTRFDVNTREDLCRSIIGLNLESVDPKVNFKWVEPKRVILTYTYDIIFK